MVDPLRVLGQCAGNDQSASDQKETGKPPRHSFLLLLSFTIFIDNRSPIRTLVEQPDRGGWSTRSRAWLPMLSNVNNPGSMRRVTLDFARKEGACSIWYFPTYRCRDAEPGAPTRSVGFSRYVTGGADFSRQGENPPAALDNPEGYPPGGRVHYSVCQPYRERRL